MLIRKDDYYQSSLLAQFSGIRHGYSTRLQGDMRAPETRTSFLKTLTLSSDTFVRPQQVHGVDIHTIENTQVHEIPATDGVVSITRGIAVGVVVADCVPLLFVDIKKCLVSAVHAGWKGTLGNIAGETVKAMVQAGSNVSDIVVSVGPHIGMCCYRVAQERIERFQHIYDTDPRVAYEGSDGWHLDIGQVNVIQLRAAGIAAKHIDAPIICTSCQVGLFYSYRKDTKETFGEIMGVVGFTG